MKLITNRGTARDAPMTAQVTFSESSGFGAMSESEKRDIPVFGPRGVIYRPCDGDTLLLIPVDGSYVCVGVQAGGDMEPGEVCFKSSGGARIELKNNGEIILNGGAKVNKSGELITKSGTIIT